METEAAKKVASGVKSVQKEILDSSSNAFYAEYKPKEIRDQERAEKMEAMKKEQLLKLNQGIPTSSSIAEGPMLPNKDAGESVVLHRSSRIANAWNSFKENSPIAQKLFSVKRGLDESDHPFLERVREWMDRTKINETEEARVIRAIREVDPTFRKDSFLKEMTQYVVPDVLEMVLREDAKSVADWCSERVGRRLLHAKSFRIDD